MCCIMQLRVELMYQDINISFSSLIQAHLGCIPVQDFTLTQDTGKIFRNGVRVTRCMVKFNLFYKYNI